MNVSTRFWDAFDKSLIVSGILALLVWGVILYLAIAQIQIPEVLGAGGALILGFFFGSRSGQQTERIQAANALNKYVTEQEARYADL